MKIKFSHKVFSIFTILFLSFAVSLYAYQIPALKGYVNDYANIITYEDETYMTQLLEAVENKTSTQIAVLTLDSMPEDEDSLEDYSLTIAESWGLGQKGKDNGVLVLVTMQEHNIRIETGYGSESLLTDSMCGLIIRNVIVPEFKKENYSLGLTEAVKNISGFYLDDVELISSDVLGETEEDDKELIVYIVIIVLFILTSILSKNKRVCKALPWLAVFNSSGNSSKRSNYRSYSSGSSHSHRSFSGGGGHFGGGGASGHW